MVRQESSWVSLEDTGDVQEYKNDEKLTPEVKIAYNRVRTRHIFSERFTK